MKRDFPALSVRDCFMTGIPRTSVSSPRSDWTRLIAETARGVRLYFRTNRELLNFFSIPLVNH